MKGSNRNYRLAQEKIKAEQKAATAYVEEVGPLIVHAKKMGIKITVSKK